MSALRTFRRNLVTVESVLLGVLAGCSDSTTPTSLRPEFDLSPGDPTTSPPVVGHIKICKDATSNVSGVFTASDGSTANNLTVTPGQCQIAAVDHNPTSGSGSTWTVTETSAGFQSVTMTRNDNGSVSGPFAATNPQGGLFLNNYHGYTLTYVNHVEPPAGKTFTIGPSSMEGAIKIANGDWVNGGYSFKFKSNTHTATNFTVAATVTITGPCSNGGSDTFTLTIPTVTYAVPAGNTNWLPTGDQNSVLSWQGSAIASGLCGGIGKLDASKGALFTATVSQNPPSGSLVDFRFKYRDPAAKGKPNTNCLDTSDPNRDKADVCGASWSQTVTDP